MYKAECNSLTEWRNSDCHFDDEVTVSLSVGIVDTSNVTSRARPNWIISNKALRKDGINLLLSHVHVVAVDWLHDLLAHDLVTDLAADSQEGESVSKP